MVALLLALFTILFFGTTGSSMPTEHHPGLMLAVAFESLVKLVAFSRGRCVRDLVFCLMALETVNPFRVDDQARRCHVCTGQSCV